jgi:predicted phosphodiesterase
MKIGLITDIHEDIVNLKHALHALEKRGSEQVVCLGDMIGFIRDYFVYENTRNARECLRLVRSACSLATCGNHDLFAIKKLPVYRGGFRFPEGWYNLSTEERRKVSGGQVWLYETEAEINLDSRDRDYIARLPEYTTAKPNGAGLMFSHFLFPSLTGTESHSPAQKQGIEKHFSFMQRMDCEFSFFGHTHAQGMIISYEPPISMFPLRPHSFDVFPFGTYKLKKRPQCIGLPAVSDSGNRNGAAVFDTVNLELIIFPIHETISHFVKQ